jgi:hypothetical protein
MNAPQARQGEAVIAVNFLTGGRALEELNPTDRTVTRGSPHEG